MTKRKSCLRKTKRECASGGQKGKLGMREEGMLWSAREISLLDKTEILDKN